MKLVVKTYLPVLLSVFLSSPLFSSELFAADYPAPIAQWQEKGVSIVSEFDAPNGMKGYTGMYEGTGITLYLLADGKHVIWGELYDEEGNDLSSVELEKSIYAKMAAEMWERMENSTWIQDGSKDAKHIVYVFMDPNCPYCAEFWHAARPSVESGKVQLRHIMVGILAEDSSQKAAAILNSEDPSQTLHEFESNKGNLALTLPEMIDKTTLDKMEANLEIMDALGATATPAIYYLNSAGRLQQQVGMPDEEQLKAIMGEAIMTNKK